VPDDADDALEAIFEAAARLPHYWVTPKLVEVSADGRTVRLDPATRVGAVLWTDRPWSSAVEHIGQPVRFHEFTGALQIGDERRLGRKGSAPPQDRVKVSPRTMDELAADKAEDVELGDWVSGWLAIGSWGEPVAGYARLSEGPLGEVIASFTLMLPEGGMSWDSSPATIHFLRYDPARNSVDYIVHLIDFPPGWSVEGATEVGEDFAAEVSDTRPAVIFQQLVDAYPELDVYPLSLEQAQEMGWLPYFEDEHPPPFEHLWRPVDLSTD
jgi:hypothetical protein